LKLHILQLKKEVHLHLAQFIPSDIWAASISGTLHVPRVNTASMSTKLAVKVGNLGLIHPTIQDSIKASDSTSESDSEKNSDSDSEKEEQEN
jgi:hypothetical protein